MQTPSITWALLCKRTEYPKLGYIIHRLKAQGIACRFASYHAQRRLEIDLARDEDAWVILDEKVGRTNLDDARDDLTRFYHYANELPSHPEAE